MPQISNLVQQTTVSTGTGNLTLAALNGRQGFNAAFGSGGTDVFFYFIAHKTAPEWEVGTGHMADALTLVRDTVLASSNNGTAVNFSAGDKDVVNDMPAAFQQPLTTLAADLSAKAAASHTHILAGITDAGTAAAKNVPASGNAAAGEVVLGSDTRLADAREPVAHTHASGDITDFTEAAQDAVGAMITDTDTIDMTYADATPQLKADVRTQMSVTSDASGLKLSGDSASPGNTKLYGTDGSGVKGWYDQPAGGGGGVSILLPETTDGWCLVHSDYNMGTSPAITSGQTSGTGATAGAAYTSADDVTRNRCGVFSMDTGTTATGRAARVSSTTANLGFKTGVEYKFGGGLRLEDAPDATEDYYVFIGFKQSASADPRSATSCGLYYDRSYTNWQMLSYLGGSSTYTDTGVAFAADTWFDMGVHVTGNDTAGSVTAECHIDGTSVGTITGVQNVSSLWTYNHEIKKLAGTTARLMYVDYEYILSRRTA